MDNLLGRQLNYTVHTPVYDGPLDLLLNLIEHAELDITSVSLAMVTDQYLAYINATSDPDTGVRIAATRALANLRHLAAFPALTQNLAYEAPAIRLSALRALARLDPDRAAALPDLARLQLDPDPRVADTDTKVARGLALRP